MDEIIAFVASHWTEWLFALMSLVLAACYRRVEKMIAVERARSEATAEGVRALLRDTIVTSYNKYNDRGYCPIYAKNSVERAYQAYHKLGGDDVATALYQKILAMDEDGKD